MKYLHSFPDLEVRRVAVNWLRSLGSDELVDYLPQLVQALKHETWEASPLAYFLLERALTSPRVAHHLYWLLAQALPGEFPQVQFLRWCTSVLLRITLMSVTTDSVLKYGQDLMC
jgi:hypothetical protein